MARARINSARKSTLPPLVHVGDLSLVANPRNGSKDVQSSKSADLDVNENSYNNYD